MDNQIVSPGVFDMNEHLTVLQPVTEIHYQPLVIMCSPEEIIEHKTERE